MGCLQSLADLAPGVDLEAEMAAENPKWPEGVVNRAVFERRMASAMFRAQITSVNHSQLEVMGKTLSDFVVFSSGASGEAGGASLPATGGDGEKAQGGLLGDGASGSVRVVGPSPPRPSPRKTFPLR